MTMQYDVADADTDDIGKEHPRPSTNKVIDAFQQKLGPQIHLFFVFLIDADENEEPKN